ncbi:hypothetical protein [Flindersiella endophytica]
MHRLLSRIGGLDVVRVPDQLAGLRRLDRRRLRAVERGQRRSLLARPVVRAKGSPDVTL